MAAATARAEKLTQAILAKAFRGELVPTEAELARREGRDYEPASVLLEQIKVERAKIPLALRGKRNSELRVNHKVRREIDRLVSSPHPRLRPIQQMRRPPSPPRRPPTNPIGFRPCLRMANRRRQF
ncbi:MAG TPA: hypothetical protein VKI65_03395 [Gemmataceae bacterium]|nr:hypothetical protein [Gemmataceae bacterium]